MARRWTLYRTESGLFFEYTSKHGIYWCYDPDFAQTFPTAEHAIMAKLAIEKDKGPGFMPEDVRVMPI